MKAVALFVGLLAVICAVAATCGAAPVYLVEMRKIGNEPAMINGPDPFINPRSNGIAGIKALTINPATGILYGMDTYVHNNGRAATFLADTAIVSTPSAPLNAKFAYVGALNNSQYTGAVRGGPANRNPPQGAAITFNPDYKEGVYVAQTMEYNVLYFYHWTMQDLSVGWGHQVELANNGACAMYADTYRSYGCCSRGTREGSAYLDHATVSGGTYSDVYRYVWYYRQGTGTANDELRVHHVATSFATTPTDTTLGRYNSEDRVGGYVLLNSAQIYALVPAAIGSRLITGLAIREEVEPDVFDIYMLFNDDAGTAYSVSTPDVSEADDLTYLAAIRATIPSDGSAMSYEVIDLDRDSDNTCLQLMDTVAGRDVIGTGIVFDADKRTMYCAGYLNYSTGNASYDKGRIYLFDVAPSPPQGTLAIIR